MSEVKTVGILTSGGDAPGMNAAIRAAVRTARAAGMKVKGIRRGYAGLLNSEIIDMDSRMVSEIARAGGTILFTARCKEFETREGQKRGAQVLKDNRIDGLIVIGGDGSFRGPSVCQPLESIPSGFRERLIWILIVLIIRLVLIRR